MNETTHDSSKLVPHEWISIAFLISFLFLLTLASHSCESKTQFLNKSLDTSIHHLESPEIEVYIEGAVEFPGKHIVKRGKTIKELIEIANPKASADLSKVKLNAILKKGQKIIVPSQEVIKIILKIEGEGCLSEIHELTLKKGTKLEELLLLFTFPEGSDLHKLQKKRRLKDGEVVFIPVCKVCN